MIKTCRHCHTDKILTEFHADKNRKDGLYPYCKDCRRLLTGSKKMIHNVVGKLDGYDVVKNNKTNYPNILLPSGSVRVHRYVAEKKLGREIYKNEDVHHIDGNKNNWSADNIVVLSRTLHRKYEGHKIHGYVSVLTCITCGRKKKYSQSYVKRRIIVPERHQCASCYYKSGGAGGRHKQLQRLIKEKKV